GHDKVRLLSAFVFELPDIENLNDIGVAYRGKNIAFFVEQLQSGFLGSITNRLEGDIAADQRVIRPVHNTHSTLAERLFHLITISQFACNCHSPPELLSFLLRSY